MVTKSACNKSKLFDGLNCEDASEIDPCYKLFLEHLRKDEKTYVLEMPNGNHGMSTFVRYEEENMAYGDANSKNWTKFSNNLPGRNQGCITGRQLSVTSSMGANVNVGHSFLASTPSGKKRSSQKKSSAVDESYEAFLHLLKIKDGYMVVEIEPGVSIIYEQEGEASVASEDMRTDSFTNEQEPSITPLKNMENENITCTDEDRLAQTEYITSEHEMGVPASDNLDNENIICTAEQGLTPYSHPSDLTACGDDQGTPLALSCCDPSTFDEKLDAVLSQPYDQNEYEEFMRKATDRKPVSRQRHLRNASKRYATGAVGLSYLDYYPDLAIQIDSADCYERLNLLRKFFFWLENLCHDGAYMPWIPKPLACDPIATDEYEPMLALEMSKNEN